MIIGYFISFKMPSRRSSNKTALRASSNLRFFANFFCSFTQVLRSCADFLIPRLIGFDEMLIANTASALEEQ
jgi:hypothetical protein